LKIVNPNITINHFGFLKTTPEQRKEKNAKYAKKLEEFLTLNPGNARAMFALGIDRMITV
jgi:hypothetical protein